jgi:glycosyltransferase involved in cell wall biosynthesis
MTLITRSIGKKNYAEIAAPKEINTSDISIVIPVKDNQNGIDCFLSSMLSSENLPKEIIIVDNNSTNPTTLKQAYRDSHIPIVLISCKAKGPAAARNYGATIASGDWLLFTDSDCIPSDSFLLGYVHSADGSIGYAGSVKSFNQDSISKYYEDQQILIPLSWSNGHSPSYLVTANCLVWKRAFERVGGFDERITIAGGEDVDLGFRLCEVGRLSFALKSVVFHNFNDGLIGFVERFVRYGIGNRLVSDFHHLDLKPRRFPPKTATIVNYFLARLQYYCLLIGYIKGATSV